MRSSYKSFAVLAATAWLVSACQHTTNVAGDGAGKKMAAVEASQTQSIINLKDVLDASTANIPTLTAVGYAVTSSQPGRSESQKRLMAIRSARMAAMRDLAEQIHGLQVDSSTTVIDLVVQNDTFRALSQARSAARVQSELTRPAQTHMKWCWKSIGKPLVICCKRHDKRCNA